MLISFSGDETNYLIGSIAALVERGLDMDSPDLRFTGTGYGAALAVACVVWDYDENEWKIEQLDGRVCLPWQNIIDGNISYRYVDQFVDKSELMHILDFAMADPFTLGATALNIDESSEIIISSKPFDTVAHICPMSSATVNSVDSGYNDTMLWIGERLHSVQVLLQS